MPKIVGSPLTRTVQHADMELMTAMTYAPAVWIRKIPAIGIDIPIDDDGGTVMMPILFRHNIVQVSPPEIAGKAQLT